MRSEYTRYLHVALIIILSLGVYVSSLGNGFIWDDDQYLYDNPLVQDSQGLKDIWFSYKTPQYYPLVFTTFWVEHKLWGLDPFGFRLVNMILHILNALLVFAILCRLYPRLAFLVALLFAIHPIQVETVAWITERKNLLCLFFFLSTFFCYLRFERTRTKGHYLQTLLLFICALLSKSVSVCFVAVPVLYRWWKKAEVSGRDILLLLPFAGLGLLGVVNTIYLELYRVGSSWDTWTLSFLERLILSGRILLFYIQKLVAPFEFIFFYPRWNIDTTQWWQWLFILASILLGGLLFTLRRRIGRGGSALFFFYVISIFPALGFITVYPMKYSFVADHFSYLSTPTLLLLICGSAAFFVDALNKRFPFLRSKAPRFLAYSLVGIAAILLCVKSISLTKSYRDELTLWQETIAKNPDAWMAYNNLGALYRKKGDFQKGITNLIKATQIKPDYAEAYYNLGNLYQEIGEPAKAITLYKTAIKVRPTYVEAHNNLGIVYYDTGKYEEAIHLHTKTIELKPDHAKAYSNLGLSYQAIGEGQQALNLFKKAIHLSPGRPQAYMYNNLGIVYKDAKKLKEAKTLFEKAIELDSGYAHAYYNLATVQYMLGKQEEAIGLFKRTLTIDPDYGLAYLNLSMAYLARKEYVLA
ncbi:tetratricopeptide repeat protein, partial [Candidatus Omnitrophota bacterium]